MERTQSHKEIDKEVVVVSQIVKNILKVFYNIGHIIYYKTYNSALRLVDMELLRPMKSPKVEQEGLVEDYIDSWYEGDDVAKILGHMDEDGDYIKEEQYKPYGGPICETP